MKKVLMITYYLPPLGGAGVQRTIKFAKYLPKFNFKPVILAPDPRLIRYVVHDKTLRKEVSHEAEIYYSFIIDLNWFFKILYGLKLSKVVDFINRHLLFPDYQIQWLPFAKQRIKGIMKKEKIDLVYITSPPHSIHSLSKWIKKNYDIPIIIDFRDPFTFSNKERSPGYFQRCFNFENSVLKTADHIIANTQYNMNALTENFKVPSNKVSVIHNGFDIEDFNQLRSKRNKDNKIIVSHIGKLYGRYNAVPFLSALNTIKDQLEDVEFRFVGRVSYEDEKLIKLYNLNGLVKLIDYCSHSQALDYVIQSDYLLLILANQKSIYCVPGKTYEYLNSGRQIIAIVPEKGCCADIIRETRTGIVVPSDNINLIAKTLVNVINNQQKNKIDPNYDQIKKYERKKLTGKLADIFIRVLNK